MGWAGGGDEAVARAILHSLSVSVARLSLRIHSIAITFPITATIPLPAASVNHASIKSASTPIGWPTVHNGHHGAPGGHGVPAAPRGVLAGQAQVGAGRGRRVLHPALRLQARQRRAGHTRAAGCAAGQPEGAPGQRRARRAAARMPAHPARIHRFPRPHPSNHMPSRCPFRWGRPPSLESTCQQRGMGWTVSPSLTAAASVWRCWVLL